jgi:hypothetical protein
MNPSTLNLPLSEGPVLVAVDSMPRIGCTEAGPAPRLDRRTLLVPGPGEGWSASVYEGAGEATIYRPERSHPSGDDGAGDERASDFAAAMPLTPADPSATVAALASPPRPSDRVDRVSRRARGRARRFAVANGCTRLWTFTYGGPDRPTWDDRARVKRDWARFARELRARWPELAWMRTLEMHADGHVHVHAAFNRGFPTERRDRVLARLWGHGFVDGRRFESKRPGRNERARSVARYVVKYATKAIADGRLEAGEHGYEVAQGFQPAVARIRAWSRSEAWQEAVRAMGGEIPAYEWDSGSSEDWRGPPVGFLSW